MSYKVRLQSFEGPFDLLVYLIENAEMSIYDIQISQITSQYLDYIHTMRDEDVYVSSEFMVLAATLVEIKSKMILPGISQQSGEEPAEEDPRSGLAARLAEYKKFKKASEMLKEREEAGMSIYEKPQEDISEYLEQPDEYLRLDLKQFAGAFRLFIEKKQRVEAVQQQYAREERESGKMEERMEYISGILRRESGKARSFKELIGDRKDRYDVVMTFISLLEMAKEHMARLEQKTTYGDILVFGCGNGSNWEAEHDR